MDDNTGTEEITEDVKVETATGMTVTEEIEMLEKKCLKKDGDPRANAKADDLIRLIELQNKPPNENDRIKVETKRGKDIIKVLPGRPMTLEGLNLDNDWKVLAVISSNGARGVKVRAGLYSEYRLDGTVSKHMQHAPPKVSMRPGNAEGSPKIE